MENQCKLRKRGRVVRVRLSAMAMVVWAVFGAAPGFAQTYNLYGEAGLLDIPTGEFMLDGELGVGFVQFGDTQRANVNFQLLPRVSGTLRVSTIQDVPGGPEVSTEGFDLRFQLLKEEGWVPGVALGFRDFLGDGPYTAEYLVATKSITPKFKVTGGVGFGRLSSQGGTFNPFGADSRPPLEQPVGQLQDEVYFRGDMGFFGGFSWETPVDGLTFKAEVTADGYLAEENGGFDRDIPFNFGLNYKPNENVQLQAFYMHGSTFGAQLTFSGNPMKPLAPQDLGAGPTPLIARAGDAPMGTKWADKPENEQKLLKGISQVLSADGITIEEARITGTEADIYIKNPLIQREPKAIGRVARVLAVGLPPSVEVFRITVINEGLAVATAEILRSDLEAQVDRPNAGLESWQTTRLMDAKASLSGRNIFLPPPEQRFTWSVAPSIPITLLDEDDGFRPDILISARAKYQVTRGLSVSGRLSRFVIGESQEEVGPPVSSLPNVRSDSDVYYSGRDIDLERLTADWVFSPKPAVYGRLTFGVLERIFTGVSAEVLWAPVNSRFALGGEVNYVRQRDVDDLFSLDDYEVVTGYGSLYWDTGFKQIEAQLDIGSYLAGDFGATLSLSRRFENGWEVRGYATRTEVSFNEFGEGAFAKGFEITVPLRWALPFETKSEARVSLLPVENDGGARLKLEERLYERIRDLDRRSLEDGWSAFWQ